MRFVKRLIIMSGESSGTLHIEKNGTHCNLRLTCFINHFKDSVLCLVIDGKAHYINIKSKTESFKLQITEELNTIHAILFCEDKALMYGTNQAIKMDLVKLQSLKPKSKPILTLTDPTQPLFSKRIPPNQSTPIQPPQQTINEKIDEMIEEKIDEKVEEKIEPIKEPIKEQNPEQNPEQTTQTQQNEYKDDEISTQNYYPQHYFDTLYNNEMKNEFQNELSVDKTPPSLKAKSYLTALNTTYKQKTNSFNPSPQSPQNSQTPYNEQREQGEYVFKAEKISNQICVDGREGTFYERMSDDIEKIFSSSNKEVELEKILPNSKWVRIDYNANSYYCLGMIGKEYLCYALPADYTPLPPQELQGYCWWLPLEPDKPKQKGYWIMYQSLTTGEAVLP